MPNAWATARATLGAHTPPPRSLRLGACTMVGCGRGRRRPRRRPWTRSGVLLLEIAVPALFIILARADPCEVAASTPALVTKTADDSRYGQGRQPTTAASGTPNGYSVSRGYCGDGRIPSGSAAYLSQPKRTHDRISSGWILKSRRARTPPRTAFDATLGGSAVPSRSGSISGRRFGQGATIRLCADRQTAHSGDLLL